MAELSNPRHERFAREYTIDGNGAAAYIRAGYSPRGANRNAFRLTSRPTVAARIAELQQEVAARLAITADRVLREVARIAYADPRAVFNDDGSLKDIHQLDPDTAAAIASFEVEDPQAVGKRRVRKVRHHDKGAALVLLGKHLQLFRDKTEGEASGDLARDLAAARKRAP